jgi:hypothetical protein
MIIKELTTHDDKKYIIGFKEIGSYKDGIECHILKQGLLCKISIYKKLYLKGLSPDYEQMTLSTIFDYERDCEDKEKLSFAIWG